MSPLMVSVSGVRGIVGPEFNPLLVARWTAAFAAGLGPGPIVLGRDSRTSGERLACVAADTLQACGRDVWDLGIVPTPTVQVAVERWERGGRSHPDRQPQSRGVECSEVRRRERLLSLREADSPHFVRASTQELGFRAAPARSGASAAPRGDEALALHRDWILAGDRHRSRSAGASRASRSTACTGRGGSCCPISCGSWAPRSRSFTSEPHGTIPAGPGADRPRHRCLWPRRPPQRGADLRAGRRPGRGPVRGGAAGTEMLSARSGPLPLVAAQSCSERRRAGRDESEHLDPDRGRRRGAAGRAVDRTPGGRGARRREDAGGGGGPRRRGKRRCHRSPGPLRSRCGRGGRVAARGQAPPRRGAAGAGAGDSRRATF